MCEKIDWRLVEFRFTGSLSSNYSAMQCYVINWPLVGVVARPPVTSEGQALIENECIDRLLWALSWILSIDRYMDR